MPSKQSWPKLKMISRPRKASQKTQDLSITAGTLIFHWNTIRIRNDILMLTWPHHRLSIENGNFPDMLALVIFDHEGTFLSLLSFIC
jgi:hypothetical protein